MPSVDEKLLPDEQSELGENRRVMRAAALIAVANVVQRLLGMGREIVKANLFGASGLLSAFTVASLVPMTLFNLIAGGEMVTSSLVPVFSDYVGKAKRGELWQVFSTFLSLTAVVLILLMLVVELFTPQIAQLVGAGHFDDGELFELTVDLMRLTTPAVLFLSISSVMTAVLYALQRFTLPAFTVSTFNAAMIIAALANPDEIGSLAWGLLVGSLLQVGLQLPALRDARFRVRFDWRHPAVRRIVRLYIPIIGGLLINQAVIWVSYNFAIQTGDESVTYMTYATTLYQLPLGLVVMGLSTATLPMLAQQASADVAGFRRTLAQGVRLVVVLVLPAAVGVFVLARPLVGLLFEHGEFLAGDTAVTAQVLRIYVFGMPFAAVDQMLVYASYARKDTLRPALVGVASMGLYLVVARLLLPVVGLYSLMVADAAKHVAHTVLMLWLLRRQMGGWRGFGLLGLVGRCLLTAVVMGVGAHFVYAMLPQLMPTASFVGRFALVALPALVGMGLYVGLALLVRVPELHMLPQLFRRG